MELALAAPTADDTRAVGDAIAPLLLAGDVIVLSGELGAGKTTFVQGLGRGLGIDEPVVSPTFTLIKEYEGRLDLVHVDIYRLDRIQDVMDLGLDELGAGVRVVEWGEGVAELLPADRMHVQIEAVDGDGRLDDRLVVISCSGSSWEDRWEEIERALADRSAP